MTDFRDADDIDAIDDGPGAGAVVDLMVIFCVAIAMCAWTWATWPDTLIDWGSQLYFAWQLSLGKVLYRDIAYYNGPFSEYFNASLFSIFGVSQRVLWYANLAILACIILMLYWLIRGLSGRFAAVTCGVVFVTVFAFSQYVELGNYNYVTPYTQEITHGLALDLAAMCLLMRYQRSRATADAAIAGLAMGLCFLTKAEIFVAGFAAVVFGFAVTLWKQGAAWAHVRRVIGAFLTTAIVPPLIALALLWQAMPLKTALRGVAGTWVWVFDSRMAQMSYYKWSTGFNDVAGNLKSDGLWLGAYVGYFGLIAVAALAKGSIDRRNRRSADRLVKLPTMLVATIITGTAFCGAAYLGSLRCYDVARPLPAVMALLGIGCLAALRKASAAEANRVILRLTLIAFATILLAKIILVSRIWHYGFALAMPATLLVVEAVVSWIPATLRRGGWSGALFKGAALGTLSGFIFAFGQLTKIGVDMKTARIGEGADWFYISEKQLDGKPDRGAEVRDAIQLIQLYISPSQTFAVVPQGLMLNYLTRRENPSIYTNLVQPEVISAGETAIVENLKKTPPDFIILTRFEVEKGGFKLNDDLYGKPILDWLQDNYRPMKVDDQRRLKIMLARHAPVANPASRGN